MTAQVQIREFNDPGCPFGYSWEVYRRKIAWLYDGAVQTRLTLIGLQKDADELERKGFTAQAMTGYWRDLADKHGMPFSFSVERHSATWPACKAVVAARINGADDRLLMRWLRIKRFGGELIDQPEVIDDAASSAGIDPTQLRGWLDDPATQAALQDDFTAARTPSAAGHALDHRLSDWEGGRRYPTPTWEVTRSDDGLMLTLPGAQAFDVYDVVMANLMPGVERRAPAEDPAQVLQWAGEPLATREIALVMEISDAEADKALRDSTATEIPLQSSSFWQV